MSERDVDIIILEEPPLVTEGARPRRRPIRRAVTAVGRGAGKTARKVWRSEARRRVTGAARRKSAAAVARGQAAVNERVAAAVNERLAAERARLREGDWRQTAKAGVAAGLRQISAGLEKLAARFTPREKSPSDLEG